MSSAMSDIFWWIVITWSWIVGIWHALPYSIRLFIVLLLVGFSIGNALGDIEDAIAGRLDRLEPHR